MMTGNIHFPNPPVSMASMSTLGDELMAAVEAAIGGSVQQRKHRDAKVAEAKEVLRMQADYQRAVCAGDAEKLASGGFELAKKPEPITVVGVAGNLRARATDQSGQLRLRWNHAFGGKLYDVEQADGDPTLGTTTWTSVGMTSKVYFDVNGLEPYAAHWFRIVAIGKDSQGLPSDIVMGRAA